MQKTFCDRCKKEIHRHDVELTKLRNVLVTRVLEMSRVQDSDGSFDTDMTYKFELCAPCSTQVTNAIQKAMENQ